MKNHTKTLQLANNSPLNDRNFMFGVATSSFQIEGSRSSRLETIWDRFCDEPKNIADDSNGDEACDHINRWHEDLALIDGLGVDAYRFSVSWARVISQDGSVNEQGIQFYERLLDGLKVRNIKAFVTLYHWDLPQYLQDKGGWLNRDTVFAFERYADLISQVFGDRVYSYATLNEPWCSAYLGYEIGIHAPGFKNKQQSKQVAHNLLLAHGLALKALNKNCPSAKNGIVLNFSPCFAATDNLKDIAAAKLADEHFNQWYLRPIIEGKYPDVIDEMQQEHKPIIEAGDMEIIGQSIDYLGINYYSRAIYQHCDINGFKLCEPPAASDLTDMGWEIYPEGLVQLLDELSSKYSLPDIYITENGAAMDDVLVNSEVLDFDRVAYFQSHLDAVERLVEQGIAIKGYFAWSLMDNFEWAEGYSKRFGIVYVDYKTQQRTLKQSAKAYRDMLNERP